MPLNPRHPPRALLRNCCRQYLSGLPVDERKAQRVGALAKSAHEPCALARVVGVGARVAIDEGAGQGAIDENGQLARGRGDGLGLADADGQPAVESAEGGLPADQPHGSEAEHGGGAIGGRLGLGAEAAALFARWYG